MINCKLQIKNRGLKGMTLAEMLVAVVISSILVAMLSTVLIQTQAVYSLTDISADLDANSRLAITKVSNELRQTAPAQISITKNTPFASTDRITYRTPLLNATDEPTVSGIDLVWDDVTTITIDPGNPTRLIKTCGGVTTVLAQNVTSIQFIDSAQAPATIDQDELKIYMTFNKRGYRQNVTMTSASTINMRN